jgi:hypothetical protein
MKLQIIPLLGALLFSAAFSTGAAEPSKDALYQEDRAVIVVTGMRLNEDPSDYRKDLSVAEGASVKVTARSGATREKKTEAYARSNNSAGQIHFTADFEVDLDATYAVVMTFKDGTVIRIEDYTLPKGWKTHFYFHSTNGTKSPASILRFVEDSKTKLRCCVYAVYPLESYRTLGGRQNL